MAHKESKDLGVSFDLPDKPSVRQQLEFRSIVWLSAGKQKYERMWKAAPSLVENWKCERIPDLEVEIDLDKETDPEIANIISYVGNEISFHLSEIGAVPKNG